MTILACFTDTPEGRTAVRRAVEEAGRLDSDVLIANIDTDRRELSLAELDIDPAEFNSGGRTVAVLPPSSVIHDAADLVLQTEQERKVALIVLGLRRRSRVGKLILGSHAQRILLDAGCPVLTVKAN